MRTNARILCFLLLCALRTAAATTSAAESQFGEVTGSSFHFVYTVALSPTNPLLNVRLDQTMTLRNDGTLENHATIRKLGFPLSRITEQFRRVD